MRTSCHQTGDTSSGAHIAPDRALYAKRRRARELAPDEGGAGRRRACPCRARVEYSRVEGMPEAKISDTGGASGVLSAASAGGAAPAPSSPVHASGTAVFYRYRDASGRVAIVDSLERVPPSARGNAEAVALEAPPAPAFALAESFARGELHWPSFGAGAACALLAGAVIFGLLRARAPFVRLLLLGGVALLGAGGYFGWVRRTTGHAGPRLQSPAALIEDARSAVQKMNERSREQQRVLRELEAER
jgi:hypothetical protein